MIIKKYNDTTYAILGILTTESRSGYAIKQFIDRSLTHFWKISYGQIYPTLKLLVEENLAEIRASKTPDNRDKKEYYLTNKGMEVLKNWLEMPVKQLPVERNEILLKLFFGQYQTTDSKMNLLKNYKQELEGRHGTYQLIEENIKNNDADNDDSIYWLMTLDYGKRVTQAEIEWCDDTLEQFSNKGE